MRYFHIRGTLIIDHQLTAPPMSNIQINAIVIADNQDEALSHIKEQYPSMRFKSPPRVRDVTDVADNERRQILAWNDGTPIRAEASANVGLFQLDDAH